MNTPSLAFLLVALCYMQREAEYYARQLNLNCPSLLERTNITEFYAMGGRDRVGGPLLTTNYVFHFFELGQLNYVERREPRDADAHIRENQNHLAHEYSQMDTNGAYQLATQWLAGVGVDVGKLEANYSHDITYPELDKPVNVKAPDGTTRKVRIVPHFCVTWGRVRSPKWGERPLPSSVPSYVVQVEVLAPTKELARLSITDPSISTRPAVEVPGQLVLEELPNPAFTNLWQHRELNATNVFGLLRTSTAYQNLMLQRMLDQAKWAIERLGLPPETLPKFEELTDSFVTPPQFGFRGIIMAKSRGFQFDENGRLQYVYYTPLEDLGRDTGSRQFHEEMARKPMLVDSNSVIELATSWLKALDVDVEALNRDSEPVADRYEYAKNKPGYLWWVTWPEPLKKGRPYVVVVVDGARKFPNRIRINRPQYARHAGIAVTNAVELMRIPDQVPQRDPLMIQWNVSAAFQRKLNAPGPN